MIPPRVKVDWRVKGGKKPEGVIDCGRTSKWGNPFRVGESFQCDYPGASEIQVPDAQTSCKFFRVFALQRLKSDPSWLDPLYAATGLACPGCDPTAEHCHVAVLVQLMTEQGGPVVAPDPVHVHDPAGPADDCATDGDESPSPHGTLQQIECRETDR